MTLQSGKGVLILKWIYCGVMLAATAVGAWALRPMIEARSAQRASALAVNVYSLPFVSAFKDTPIGAHTSSLGIDNFFTQDVLSQAVVAIVERKAPPFAKGADRDAWSRDFATDLTIGLNDHMGRRYRDSLQRMDVTNQAKGLVLVRVENQGKAPVEDIRVEVAGGQMFMEGAPAAAKFRSLGTRALRFGAIGPGEKADLFVLTTEDMSPGAGGPRVKVSAKDQTFPVVVHSLDSPARPTPEDLRWIAFAVVYLALIFAGLGMKAASLAGMRWVPAVSKAAPSAVAMPILPTPIVQEARPPADPAAWQRRKG